MILKSSIRCELFMKWRPPVAVAHAWRVCSPGVMDAAGPRMLIAGTDPEVAGLRALLADLGHAVCAATRSGREAVAAVQAMADGDEPRPDLALIDPALDGEVSGVAAARRLRRRFGIPVIYVCDGELPARVARAARMAEPAGYVPKPVAAWHLQATIDAALAQHRRETGLAERARRLARERGALRRRIATLQDRAEQTEAAAFRDITRLKETQWKLKETARRAEEEHRALQTVLDSIGDGVVTADADGTLALFNPSAARILGLGSTDVPPEQRAERYGVYYPDQATPVPADGLPLTRATRGEPSDEEQFFVRNPSVPHGVFVSVSGRPLRDGAGTLNGGVVVIRDVTEHVRAHQALLQAFAQGRLDVLDTIVHNIGNAINSVAIGVGTIQHELARNRELRRFRALAEAVEQHRDDWPAYVRTDPQGQRVLPFIVALAADFEAWNRRLTDTVERVRGRVTHIVDLIRTQKSFDSRSMERKLVDLRRSIADAVTMMADSCASRGIEVDIDCTRAPRELWIHESRFHQMLVNLLKNAIEAIDALAAAGDGSARPDAPRIRIACYLQVEYVVLDVTDNGIGIGEQRHRLIFTAGYTTKKSGSGLGLHSAANFVIGSGGSIRALSDGHGTGTTIRIKLRRAATEGVPDRAERAAAPPSSG